MAIVGARYRFPRQHQLCTTGRRCGEFAVELYGLNGEPLRREPGQGPTGKLTPPVLEVHLFDFNAEIYVRRVRVDFLHKLLDEAKYPDLDSLVAQIRRDVDNAKHFLKQRHARL
jgi:riboflavin kinase/FMN adenylyltransferase